jgi:hypothetical protein
MARAWNAERRAGIAQKVKMTPLILKRAPIGWNQDDFDVVENGVIVGRIFKVPIATARSALDVGERAQRRDTPRGARLRGDARGGDGGVREELA